MVGNISDRDIEMATTQTSPRRLPVATATAASPTPIDAITSSRRAGRTNPSSQNMRKRPTRKVIRLACRNQPAYCWEIPTASRAYWMVKVHVHVCAATLKNWAPTP